MVNKPTPTLPRVEGSVSGHQRNWVEACLNGTPTSSNFEKAGKLTEAVLMGNLAIRAYQYKVTKVNPENGRSYFEYPGRQKIKWDGNNMRVTNFDKANEWVNGSYRAGWELK